jgi:hypothetical protein
MNLLRVEARRGPHEKAGRVDTFSLQHAPHRLSTESIIPIPSSALDNHYSVECLSCARVPAHEAADLTQDDGSAGSCEMLVRPVLRPVRPRPHQQTQGEIEHPCQGCYVGAGGGTYTRKYPFFELATSRSGKDSMRRAESGSSRLSTSAHRKANSSSHSGLISYWGKC